ncbi:MAG TPA: aldehyde ferredoxin oxidoreductase family protein [Candidatus Aminicenantes bacterium]|nr:aldehyde ferredoxin oxidoreductase family protein [Candidatus Aminicenantes bacterium]HRY64697.1 aldehyde ferredoxin oxidoreductase family protein [Candidatus Aminicenantes bacterium]HRZ71610.1 aldehyde ferredoxin oxidoreductase family protein [Candidatus Aminicenantes bacterium]
MSDYPISGYFGRVLVVDLSLGEVRTEPLDPATALDYLGGRGLATRLLYDTIDPACEPLGPDNAFVIASSPLVGTSAPTAGRGHMVFKSPLTGVIGTSNSGGTWGAAFKAAGWDALVVTGAAASPVMIDIAPGRAEIRPADDLWGKTVHETNDLLAAASEPGRPARVLCIGPAGENLVRFAVVANDANRVYGRCGAGAVWGGKKLKAVRVRGREKIAVADKERFQSGLDQALYLIKQAPVTKRLMRDLGTAGLVELINLISMLPHRNFQDCTHRDEDVDRVSGETLAKTLLEKAGSCYLCPIGCQRHTRVAGRDGKEERGEGPEYETMVLMGPLCGIYDMAAITRANYRANELGLDTMSYGGTVACAMEMAGLGLIGPGETGGIDLSFGGAEALEALVGMTARREGIGAALAEGAYRLAAGRGRPDLAMTVKKLELPAYDPRASYTQALGYMTSPSGACHLRGGYAVSLAFFGGAKEIPRFSLLQSPIAIRNMQNLGILQDSLGVCRFTGYAFSADPWARMVSGVTGRDFSVARLEEIENRVAALERQFNVEAGATAADDALPDRFADSPIVVEGRERRVSRDDQERMKRDYYEVRGWDRDGRPTPGLLRALRIEESRR